MTQVRTPLHKFGGFNIRGTPRMSAKAVAHDLKVIRAECDVAVVAEFKWDYYWGLLKRIFHPRGVREWGVFPGMAKGMMDPVFGAQAVLWERAAWKRCRRGSRTKVLHNATRGVTERRYLRGVRLADRETGLEAWFAVTHYVVKGDEVRDEPLRKNLMRQDIRNTARFISRLRNAKPGAPIILQLDANIRPGSWAYGLFMEMVRDNGGRVVGEHGIEYIVVFDKHSLTKVRVARSFQIAAAKLKTDHEGRAMVFYLWRRRA